MTKLARGKSRRVMDFGCAALATVALCLSMRPFFFEKRERERERERKGGQIWEKKRDSYIHTDIVTRHTKPVSSQPGLRVSNTKKLQHPSSTQV